MEGRRIPLTFPLIAAPKSKKAFDPYAQLLSRVFRELWSDQFKYLQRTLFVSDGRAFNRVENIVMHQIFLVGLFAACRAKFGGWGLAIDRRKGRDGIQAFRSLGLQPLKSATEPCFVDSGQRA